MLLQLQDLLLREFVASIGTLVGSVSIHQLRKLSRSMPLLLGAAVILLVFLALVSEILLEFIAAAIAVAAVVAVLETQLYFALNSQIF